MDGKRMGGGLRLEQWSNGGWGERKRKRLKCIRLVEKKSSRIEIKRETKY